MKWRVSSPTRVDLAGGTLDLWPLHCFVQGAVTVNLAIDIRTHAEIEETSGEIVLESLDLDFRKSFRSMNEVLADQDPRMGLYRPVLRELNPKGGFHLRTRSESPVGGGLGGSSSLMISILKAFSQRNEKVPESVAKLVDFAHNLEAEILNTPTGTQDYFPAVSGGLNILKYSNDGVLQEVRSIEGTPFERKFLLVHTGRSHHSGMNNFEVMKGAVAKDPVVLGALLDLKQVALEMEHACRQGQWALLSDLFRREYQARVRLAPAFTCPEIEQLDRLTSEVGAEAIKICGAGGGGCVMVWCPENGRETIAEACRKAGFQVLNALPVSPLV